MHGLSGEPLPNKPVANYQLLVKTGFIAIGFFSFPEGVGGRYLLTTPPMCILLRKFSPL